MGSELNDIVTRPGLVATPQSEQADPKQVQNSAGGFTFQVDEWDRLTRFLVLGTSGGSYYASQRKLTTDNVAALRPLILKDPKRFVATVVEVSEAGRAPKNDQALFALALAAGAPDVATRQMALAALPQVARIGTHLFMFMGFLENHRGWGRSARRAVARWYNEKDPGKLAYQIVKYQERDGVSHSDAIRLSHPDPATPDHRRIFDFVLDRHRAERVDSVHPKWGTARKAVVGDTFEDDAPMSAILRDFKALRSSPTDDQVIQIAAAGRLPWEAFPSEYRSDRFWKALIAGDALPIGALIRQLPTLTSKGLFNDLSLLGHVVGKLSNEEEIRKARIHPYNVLVALYTYRGGRSLRGTSTWTPVGRIIDALDKAFYLAFGNVTPANKRTMLALDVSGSMGAPIAGGPLSCREGSVAMALVTAAVEPAYAICGFTSTRSAWASPGGRSRFGGGIEPLSITPRQRLDDAVNAVSRLPFGDTDCSLPMLYALDQGAEIETFVVYTDNETWAGSVHPHEALETYRHKTGIPARLIVVGMTATDFTIASPDDAGMLDVVGFDSAAPEIISSFSRGEI